MDQANSVVCICETREQAQRGISNLQRAGVDMGTLSVLTRDVSLDVQEVGHYDIGDQTFQIPGIGSLLVSGPLSSWIVAAFDYGAGSGGVSTVGSALAVLGIPRDSIIQYEAALKAGEYLLVLHGLPDAVAAALPVIGGTTHCSHTVHGEKVFDIVRGSSSLGRPAYRPQT